MDAGWMMLKMILRRWVLKAGEKYLWRKTSPWTIEPVEKDYAWILVTIKKRVQRMQGRQLTQTQTSGISVSR